MLGDVINIKEEYIKTANELTLQICKVTVHKHHFPEVITIAGESGSGKSVTAVCLQKRLAELGISAFVLHQDDYFFLPPASNHKKRLENIAWVGLDEVNLGLIEVHIEAFKRKERIITKPLVNYGSNWIVDETIDLSPYECLIVEGTYVNTLKNSDCYIFMNMNYMDTMQQRIARGRETEDPFIERVLAIEHKLIQPQIEKADIIVHKDYTTSLNETWYGK